MRLVITFPDFKGQSCRGFGQQLAAAYPSAKIAPILNGPEQGILYAIGEEFQSHDERFQSIIVEGQGLLAATLEGYQNLTRIYPEHTIVKLDTAEHPIDQIGRLAEEAAALRGFAVGDLEFTDEQLVPGTPDWRAHREIFPEIYGRASGGELRLSCAHGFQAFAPGICAEALGYARVILDKVKEYMNGELPKYGLDGTMALACAVPAMRRVKRIGIPAIAVRNRAAEKVQEQVDAHTLITRAVEELYS